MRKILLVMPVFLLAASLAYAGAFRAGDSGFYVCEVGGRTVGYCRYKIEAGAAPNSKKALKVTSSSYTKIASSDKSVIESAAIFYIDERDYAPMQVDITTKGPFAAKETHISFGGADIKISKRINELKFITFEIKKAANTHYLPIYPQRFDYFFPWILNSIFAGAKGPVAAMELNVFDDRTMEQAPFEIKPPKDEGKDIIYGFSFEFTNGTITLSKAAGIITKIEIPEYGIIYKYSTTAPDNLMSGLGPVIAPIGKSITESWYIRSKIKIHMTGYLVEPLALSNNNQEFRGKVKDNVIEGEMQTGPEEYTGKDCPKMPFPDDEKLSPEYTGPTALEEVNDRVIRDKAAEIVSGITSSWEAAAKLNNWIYHNIAYNEENDISAKAALEYGFAGSYAKALLLVSMLKGLGIPARTAGGLFLNKDAATTHNWAQAWMGKKAGWIDLDPTTGLSRKILANNILLWIDKNASFDAYNIKPEIKILNAERSEIKFIPSRLQVRWDPASD